MPYKIFSFHYGGKGEEHGLFFVLADVANEKYNELKDLLKKTMNMQPKFVNTIFLIIYPVENQLTIF